MEIDFANLKEGTVTKPDGTKVTTTIKKEHDGTSTIKIVEKRPDGSESMRSVRKKLTGNDKEEMDEMYAKYVPGTVTKPDGAKVTTTIDKKDDGSSVTTVVELQKDGTETTKTITVNSDGSRSMASKIKGPTGTRTQISNEEAQKLLKDAKPGTVTHPDGTKVTTTVKHEGTYTVTTIETAKPDGSVSTRTIRQSTK
uniref:G5 domain-containing protein n=1 Tax=Steinernema glaseri TaxID=37863 RepID=A0A1I7ZFV3_9BILA